MRGKRKTGRKNNDLEGYERKGREAERGGGGGLERKVKERVEEKDRERDGEEEGMMIKSRSQKEGHKTLNE